MSVLAVALSAGCGNEVPSPTFTTTECLADPACDIPLVSSHRGLCGSEPENTIAAYLECQEAGVTMVEIDPRETADGTIVIMHDGDVIRTTDGEERFPGRVDVSELTADEFASLVIDDPRCVDDPDATPQRCHPPTLQEVLDATSDDLLLDVDFKAGDPERLATLVLAAGAADRVLFFDSNVESLRAYRAVIPDGVVMPRGHDVADFEALLAPENADLDLRWVHGDGGNIADVAAVLAGTGVRLYVNGWDLAEGPDLYLMAAEAFDEPGQTEELLAKAWAGLDSMIAAGASALGTNYGHLYAGYLYPEGFGN